MALDRFYRVPKKQSETVTLTNIKMLFISPILGLAVSIWALGNRQMFDNVIDPMESQGQMILSHHLLGDWKHMFPDYTHIQLLTVAFVVATIGIVGLCIYQYIRWEFYDKQKEFRVMPNYTTALPMQTCEDFFTEENLYRDKGGFKIMTDLANKRIEERIKAHDNEDEHSCHLHEVKMDDDLLKPPMPDDPHNTRSSPKRGSKDEEVIESHSLHSVTSHELKEQEPDQFS